MEPGSNIQPLLDHVIPWMLVMFRLAGVFFMAPILTSVQIPRVYKALLIIMLSAAIYPIVRPSLVGPVRVDVWGLIPLIVSESLIGLAMGTIASIPLMSLEMSGVLMGQSMGLGLARVYNPEADFDADIIGQFLYYIGAGIFIALGGLELLMGGIIESFTRVSHSAGSRRTAPPRTAHRHAVLGVRAGHPRRGPGLGDRAAPGHRLRRGREDHAANQHHVGGLCHQDHRGHRDAHAGPVRDR